MSGTRHERPGVYSVYDASGVTTAGRAPKVIGVAALAVKGTAGTVVKLTRYSAGVEAFGEDAAAAPGMSTLLKLLAGQEQPDAGEVLLPEGWRSALRTFDLADVPYPRDPESPRLRDLKRAVTEECLRGSGR